MAYELSVNLEYGFTEAGDAIEDRIAAAAAAGFSKVELFLLKGRDLRAIKNALDTYHVELVSTVADYVTQLVDQATHDSFCTTFRESAAAAKELGCRNVVVTSGRGVPWLKRPVQLSIFADALRKIVPIAEELDVIILLESANTRHDHPGVLCSTTADSVAVADMLNHPRVRLLYDLYHSVVEGEDPAAAIALAMPRLAHVQIADAPGRGEPGSGSIDWPAALALLESAGYRGLIGVECQPTGPTAPALAYVQELAAA
jgi:hydroxypyruvate isomerase